MNKIECLSETATYGYGCCQPRPTILITRNKVWRHDAETDSWRELCMEQEAAPAWMGSGRLVSLPCGEPESVSKRKSSICVPDGMPIVAISWPKAWVYDETRDGWDELSGEAELGPSGWTVRLRDRGETGS